jgi:glycine reductase
MPSALSLCYEPFSANFSVFELVLTLISTKTRNAAMGSPFRAVHYLNQFFGQIGSEDKADTPPLKKTGAIGPGRLFQELLGEDIEVVGSVICGDNYFNENIDTAKTEVVELIKSFEADVLVAGPAFNAGRYGVACGAVCEAVKEQLGIPVVTGMFPENPGVDLFKKSVYIIEAKSSTLGMKEAAEKMSAIALKLVKGESLGLPEAEGYIPKGIRKNYLAAQTGACRAVEMLLEKLAGASFISEYTAPVFDRVAPLPPIKKLDEIKLALITSGGIVPAGNPDRIESSAASRYQKYDVRNIETLRAREYEAVHGGYDPAAANADPNRVLPLDVTRELQREAVIGNLYSYYYATVGNGTTVSNAMNFAREIAKDLLSEGVNAVIISST